MSKPVLEKIDSEKRFQLLVEAVTDYAIYLLDADGKIASWNSGAERINGYSSGEVIGQHFSLFFTPEDRAAGKPQRALETARREGRFEDEGWRQRKDGTRFWSLAVLDAIRDPDGNVIGFAKVTRDMTERREAQQRLEETREQLFQAQKMEAIGQLTGGVAHDFNNLLTVIIGGSDLAEARVKDDPKLKQLIVNIREAALRGERLTEQLLAFSRRQPLKPERIDLAKHLKTTVELLSRSLRGDIVLESDVEPGLWPVMADPRQLELALLNICLNARDAMPDGGKISLRLRNWVGGGATHYVVVEVEDTGIGMSPEVKARAFEPFFTTKDVGRGSGLGLSQAYGFATQSGGSLVLSSEQQRGTKVSLFLPAATDVEAKKPESRETPETVPAREGRTPTVLLVEDDVSVGALAVGMLEGAGYKVIKAENAATALGLLRGGAHVDLLFSDIMMPGGMNGAELASRVRREFPSIFVLLTTGYAEAAAYAMANDFALIRKPYGRDVLLDRVGKILGEAS